MFSEQNFLYDTLVYVHDGPERRSVWGDPEKAQQLGQQWFPFEVQFLQDLMEMIALDIHALELAVIFAQLDSLYFIQVKRCLLPFFLVRPQVGVVGHDTTSRLSPRCIQKLNQLPANNRLLAETVQLHK